MATRIGEEQFYQLVGELYEKSTDSPLSSDQRAAALASFQENGLPTIKDEEWKYTNLRDIIKDDYAVAAAQSISEEDIKNALPEGLDTYLLVFSGATLVKELSTFPTEKGVFVSTLSEAKTNFPEVVAAHLGKYADDKVNAFTALNTATSADGLFVYLKKGALLEKPVTVLQFVSEASIAMPRALVVAEENAQFSIMEQQIGVGTAQSFSNSVWEFYVAKNAHVNHYKLQVALGNSSHVGTVQVAQEGPSFYANTVVTMEGATVRNNLNIALDGEYCEAFMNGLTLASGATHVDNHTAVDHKKPNCHSNQLYKSILDGKAHGVFNGKIFVREHAQKTNAFQSNKNILLTEDANMDTKPQLEIWADDVVCSHGCTVGALDEEPLFYLKSRGIPEKVARGMLLKAFAADVLDRIKEEPIKAYIENEIEKRL